MNFLLRSICVLSFALLSYSTVEANCREDRCDRDERNHRRCNDKQIVGSAVVGTYISDRFLRPDPITGTNEPRALLITIHADGTVSTYNSQAYSKVGGSSPAEASAFNGIQLTPSLGTWEYFNRRCNTIRFVAYDFFAFPVNAVSAEDNPNNFQVQASWNNGEYDRFTGEINFSNLSNHKYQEGILNLSLTGISQADDPLNPNVTPTAEYTVNAIRIRRINVAPFFN